jgi:hypothetical protein
MSSSLETYTIRQLNEAEANLIKQIERIRKERKSRREAASSSSLFSSSLSSLWNEGKSSEGKSAKVKVVKKVTTILAAPGAAEGSRKSTSSDDGEPDIKATVASIKTVLKYHEIEFPSNAKKDELCAIVRKHGLVRECVKKEENKKAATEK